MLLQQALPPGPEELACPVLIKPIEDWLEETNSEQVVFRWKWKLEDIENAFLPKGQRPVPTVTHPPRGEQPPQV